jgi:hypothetical protein
MSFALGVRLHERSARGSEPLCWIGEVQKLLLLDSMSKCGIVFNAQLNVSIKESPSLPSRSGLMNNMLAEPAQILAIIVGHTKYAQQPLVFAGY